MIPYCKAHGIGIIPWAPLHSGALAKPAQAVSLRKDSMSGTPLVFKLTKEDSTIVDRVEEIAKKRGWKMGQVALAWIDTKVVSPIGGCSTVRFLPHFSMKIF